MLKQVMLKQARVLKRVTDDLTSFSFHMYLGQVIMPAG